MPSPKSREAAFFYGASPEPVLACAGCDVRRAGARGQRRAGRSAVAPPYRVVGRAGELRHPGRLGRLHCQRPPQRSVARAGEGVGASRVLHGAAAGRYYAKLCAVASGLPASVLPSPSPANAAWSLPRLVEAYRPVADAVTPFKPPGARGAPGGGARAGHRRSRHAARCAHAPRRPLPGLRGAQGLGRGGRSGGNSHPLRQRQQRRRRLGGRGVSGSLGRSRSPCDGDRT